MRKLQSMKLSLLPSIQNFVVRLKVRLYFFGDFFTKTPKGTKKNHLFLAWNTRKNLRESISSWILIKLTNLNFALLSHHILIFKFLLQYFSLIVKFHFSKNGQSKFSSQISKQFYPAGQLRSQFPSYLSYLPF